MGAHASAFEGSTELLIFKDLDINDTEGAFNALKEAGEIPETATRLRKSRIIEFCNGGGYVLREIYYEWMDQGLLGV